MKSTLHVVLLATGLLLALPASAQDGGKPLRFGDPESQAYDVPFFPGAHYDPAVPPPEALLGRPAGDRLAHAAEIVTCFRAWAASTDRVVVEEHGETHEGRVLIHAVITSPANQARLDAILATHHRLFDPRGEDPAELDHAIESLPAVAWMGYSIHGDEVSGCDAALALGYHLAACTDPAVTGLLDDLVVVIDPCLNPDGRERILGMIEQATGHAAVFDHAGMNRGRWPWGRGNHYLFDMNRDWIAGTQPETRARWAVARRFHPQLFVDAHEMGPLETFLFYPQADPINPALPPHLVEWQRRFALGAAAAFDRLGWSYYTREWADGWAPVYSDSYGSLLGGTGMLYEQANGRGTPVRKATGRVEPYRETVHHQVVASWANLLTLRANRVAALRDQLAWARQSVAPDAPGNDRALYVVPHGNATREQRFLAVLQGQGIEYGRIEGDATTLHHAERWDGTSADEVSLSGPLWVVPTAQPLSGMVRAFLSFDQRMDDTALKRERESLERTGASKVYDVTSWSLPLAYGLDAYWADAPAAAVTPVAAPPATHATVAAHVPDPSAAVGWVVDGRDDASVAFAARALQAGLVVYFSDRPFRVGDAPVARGSLLVRRSENPGDAAGVEARVLAVAEAAGVRVVHRAPTGLADPRDPGTGEVDPDAPDFGGGHFHLLERPRVGVLANAPVEPDTFGHLWWQLDLGLGIPVTQVDAQSLGAYDLRRYTVLVVPPGDVESVLAAQRDALDEWVRAGGTLIACGNAAAALTAEDVNLTDVVQRRDALEDLDKIAAQVAHEIGSREVTIDDAAVWGAATGAEAQERDASAKNGDDEPAAKEDEKEPPTPEEDAWMRRFSPFGAMLLAWADPEHWLTVGLEETTDGKPRGIPVPVDGDHALLSHDPVETPVRLLDDPGLRVSGLAWPEARARLAESAWLTDERRGDGQVILFAAVPGYRGYEAMTGRLFANAVVYGPALGTSRPVPR